MQKNFLYRVFSLCIALPAFLFMLVYSRWSYLGLFAFISSVCLYEFLKMNRGILSRIDKYIVTFLGLSFYLLSFFIIFEKIKIKWMLIPPVVMLIFNFYKVFSTKRKSSVNALGVVSLGFIYITFPFCLTHILVIREGEYCYKYLLFTFLCIWGADTGGYVFGNLFGKRKIFPSVSPNKTWEGALGGCLSSIVFGFLGNYFMKIFSQNLILIIVSFFIAFFSIWGDFLESFLKRSLGVKDSGKIIPGHGGMLDRFDSFISTSVVVAFLINFL